MLKLMFVSELYLDFENFSWIYYFKFIKADKLLTHQV